MVVCKSWSDLKSELSDQWEYMVQLQADSLGAVLIGSHPYMPLFDLTSQPCAALSGFADK